jgi:outer membrane protein OmpA-like peptidoglycan-associated protein
MTLNLVKGDFTELEDALRAQVQKLEEENNRLDEKIFLLDQENKLNVAELTELKTHNKLMLDMIAKRDTKIQDLEILVEGHRESIREYKLELKQLETPINFDPDDE